MEDFRILAINPGSTSTKIAVYFNTNPLFVKTIKHSSEDLAGFDKITDQYAFRKEIIYQELKDAGVNLDDLSAIVGRGGVVKPIPSGVYEVNDALIRDLKNSPLKRQLPEYFLSLYNLQVSTNCNNYLYQNILHYI